MELELGLLFPTLLGCSHWNSGEKFDRCARSIVVHTCSPKMLAASPLFVRVSCELVSSHGGVALVTNTSLVLVVHHFTTTPMTERFGI